ncbi:TetR/AcrR family transcriptional regulator [Loigolactobacillus backii]|uniref:TetR family transcriptional regulator n=1 Tax=Loigolactobacillus backii TaxID=375175 RepID=A0A192H2G7_9LACO|nr:TetR/AcrR family transcriptional regulator [Loigolactobacillus backii]ANK60423.1 TetR family transcriptional regulator [Loigolactobacillus backii]ANK62136.1 TetR family transcriptional regulator [Loigolactobacillus backii]ANK65302.1 TetR family transcriptional regulator [Loigolactobacillus backii]ANK67863.1 TetR family transcriptional regulator [Loigolactobacillus backii]ANK70849.1 TetR family transcriptional regulator [Loigolactobacillus backii]
MVKKRTLTKEKVLEMAEQLIEEKGINQLTIRDLASALEVRPQSIYNYAHSLGDLLDQVGLHFINQISQQLTKQLIGISGRKALMTFAQEFRQACKQHPGLAPLLLDLNTLPRTSKTHQALIELYRDVFTPLQLTDDTTKVEATLYRSTLFGFIVQEIGGFLNLPAEVVDERFDQTMTLAIDQVRKMK